MDETAIIESIYSPDVYSPDLGEWLSRQPDHVNALEHYDRYAESIKAKDNTIDGRLQQLEDLARFVGCLVDIADQAQAKQNNVHGLPDFAVPAGHWLTFPKNIYLAPTQSIIKEIGLLKIDIQEYLNSIAEMRTHKTLSSDDKAALEFNNLKLAHHLKVSTRKLNIHIDSLNESLEEYSQNHSSNNKGATEYDRMSVMLAYYCGDKVMPELSECLDRLHEAISEGMKAASVLTHMDPSVAIIGNSMLRVNNTSQRPTPVVEGDGANVIRLRSNVGAEIK